jgi:hypothetical protein
MMAYPYTPPGVTVDEIVGTSVSPILAGPTTLCVVGLSSGAINAVEQTTLQYGDADGNPATADAPVPILLRGVPVDATLNGISEVRDAFSGVVYTPTTDYTVQPSNRTITPVASGTIADGTVVRVRYAYTPSNYFAPFRCDSIQAVEERYGSAWSADGLSIGSPVSHGALVAFENGAPFVYVQALFTPGDVDAPPVQPTTAGAASASTWVSTLAALRDIPEINVVCPIIGQADVSGDGDVSSGTLVSIFNAVQDHIWYMKSQDQWVVGVLGEDSSNGVEVTSTTIINHALALQQRYDNDISEHLALVSPAKFVRGTAGPNQTMFVGGQYAAAAVAGQLASRRVETPLTRKPINGFLRVAEIRRKEQKNAEAENGILVVEQRGDRVQIRHGLTVNNTSIMKRELSIVRAKHFMIETLFNTFETQIVGQTFADDAAAAVVRSAVIATLERLRSLNIIERYRNVDSRLLTGDPTVAEVRFDYQPLAPLNYVRIIFSLNFETQEITNVTTGTTV